jgi:hypothetical protein
MNRTFGSALVAWLVLLAATTAPAADVPTWQVGDWWDVAQTFNLDFGTSDALDLAINMAIEQAYRLTVDEIADRTTSAAGTVRIYRRTRTSGTVTGTGQAMLGEIPIDVRWQPGGTSIGEEWIAVGDLANVREHFELSGTLEARVIFWLEAASVSVSLTFDLGPPLERPDFPVLLPDEQWQTTVTQRISGFIRVAWDPDFPLWPDGTPPEDLDFPIDMTGSNGVTYRFAGREPRGDFPDTWRIDMEPVGSFWYAPEAKDFIETAPEDLLGDNEYFGNFQTVVTAYNVASDVLLDVVEFIPENPERGSWVQLLGETEPNTPVEATLLANGSTASTVSDATGAFALDLQCPGGDDNTPATDDAGSFGIEMVADGVGRKVVTVQLGWPPTRAHRTWELYR